MRITSISKSLLVAICCFSGMTLSAAPGDLDPTFGNGGIVTTPLVNSPDGIWATSMVVQPDGKIVVGGDLTTPGDEGLDYFSSFFIARYNPDGTLDNSFGTNGKIIAPFDFGVQIAGHDIGLQPDGKIIAVGANYTWPNYGFVVHRYNPDGTPDNTFCLAGRV